MKLENTLRDLVENISDKTGENFNNIKLFVVIPVGQSNSNRNQYLPQISQYGG